MKISINGDRIHDVKFMENGIDVTDALLYKYKSYDFIHKCPTVKATAFACVLRKQTAKTSSHSYIDGYSMDEMYNNSHAFDNGMLAVSRIDASSPDQRIPCYLVTTNDSQDLAEHIYDKMGMCSKGLYAKVTYTIHSDFGAHTRDGKLGYQNITKFLDEHVSPVYASMYRHRVGGEPFAGIDGHLIVDDVTMTGPIDKAGYIDEVTAVGTPQQIELLDAAMKMAVEYAGSYALDRIVADHTYGAYIPVAETNENTFDRLLGDALEEQLDYIESEIEPEFYVSPDVPKAAVPTSAKHATLSELMTESNHIAQSTAPHNTDFDMTL